MATQLITNVALLVSPRNTGSDVAGSQVTRGIVVAEKRQVVAAAVAEQIVIFQEAEEVSREEVEEAVIQLKAYVQTVQRDIEFIIDEQSGRIVVRVVDSVTHEVIRQIPSEEMLAISRHLAEVLEAENKGLFVELKA